MNELPERARRLLDILREDDETTAEERVRADAAVRSALAAVGVSDLPQPEPAAGAKVAPPGDAASGGRAASRLALPIGIGAVGAAVAGLLALHALPRAGDERPAAPGRPAPPAVAPASPSKPSPAEPVVQANANEPVERVNSSGAHVRPHSRVASDTALEVELGLIARANNALQAERFAEMRLALHEHERQFPHGSLRIEREALRVLLLCRTSPGDRARSERDRFLRAAPQSLLAERVRAGCPDDREHRP